MHKVIDEKNRIQGPFTLIPSNDFDAAILPNVTKKYYIRTKKGLIFLTKSELFFVMAVGKSREWELRKKYPKGDSVECLYRFLKKRI
jgi:hypothetical protein